MRSLWRRSALPLNRCVLVASGFGFAACLHASPAAAACFPGSLSDIIASCTGITINQGGGAPGTSAGADGYGTLADNNVTVNIVPGATVTGNFAGIGLGTGATIVNGGGLTGNDPAGAGIFLGGTANIINLANATITGNTAIQTGGLTTIVNGGALNGTGGTAIAFVANGNTLTLLPGSTITGNVIGGDDNILQLGGTGNGTFNLSSISPTGQFRTFDHLNVIGGTWTATGTATYPGTVNVNAGVLLVNGDLSSSNLVTVGPNAILGGTGTVGNTTINGGSLSPGLSDTIAGNLTVKGNLLFSPTSLYVVNFTGAGGNDIVQVTGNATLGNATVSALFTPDATVKAHSHILHADGVLIGNFNPVVNSNVTSAFVPTVTNVGNDVFLDITLDFNKVAGPGGLTDNQGFVANALSNSFKTTGTIPGAFGLLNADGLTQVSGETATGVQITTQHGMDKFVEMIDPAYSAVNPGVVYRGGIWEAGVDRGVEVRYYADEADAYARRKPRSAAEREAFAATIALKGPPRSLSPQRWTVWGAAYGGEQRTDGVASVGSSDLRSTVYGGAAGFSYLLSPQSLVGFSLGGAGTNFSVANGLGSGRSDMFQAAVYGRHNIGPAYLAGVLAYGWQDTTTERTVLGSRLRARFDTDALAGRLEAGYRFDYGRFGVTPYGAGQFTTLFLPAYAEQLVAGVNTFALSYAAKEVTASRSELGVRADTSFRAGAAAVTLRGRAAWAHNFNTDRNVTATFQTLPGVSFLVSGASQASDVALLSAGAEAQWMNGVAVAATFEGEFSDRSQGYAGKGVVKYRW